MFVRWTKTLVILIASTLTACSMMPDVSSVLPDRKVDYKKEKQAGADLEIPPDLTSSSIDDTRMVPDITPSGTATYSDYVGERKLTAPTNGVAGSGAVLPQIENISVKRDGDQRWLVVRAPVDDVWYKVISFWHENGILLLEQDPSVGVMRTNWIENRADIKSDFVTDFVRKAFDGAYSAATRDQYRVRLEEGEEAGVTEIYLTHRGMEETFIKGTADEDENATWAIRPTDHGLEAEMMRKMMIFFGVSDMRASKDLAKSDTRKRRSQLLQGRGQSELKIAEEFPRAWRITGMALDRGGFAVEDRDRGKGIYYVRYNDPMQGAEEEKGILSKLAFWSDDDDIDKETQYQVRLHESGEATRVTIQDNKGVQSNSDTAKRILGLLHEQIK